MQDNSRWLERNVNIFLRILDPVKYLLDVGAQDVVLIAVPDSGLEQYPDRVRQLACKMYGLEGRGIYLTYSISDLRALAICKRRCCRAWSSVSRMGWPEARMQRLWRLLGAGRLSAFPWHLLSSTTCSSLFCSSEINEFKNNQIT